eukprot:765518-Hanusia_phi.AAC.18
MRTSTRELANQADDDRPSLASRQIDHQEGVPFPLARIHGRHNLLPGSSENPRAPPGRDKRTVHASTHSAPSVVHPVDQVRGDHGRPFLVGNPYRGHILPGPACRPVYPCRAPSRGLYHSGRHLDRSGHRRGPHIGLGPFGSRPDDHPSP